jgi:hypothetical protein
VGIRKQNEGAPNSRLSRPASPLVRIHRGRLHFTIIAPAMSDINEGKPWSQQDDDDLLLSISDGDPVDWVASFLCRSQSEVLKRAAELGLRWDGTRH